MPTPSTASSTSARGPRPSCAPAARGCSTPSSGAPHPARAGSSTSYEAASTGGRDADDDPQTKELNSVYGIAAIDKSTFFIQDAKFVVAELNTWGWVLLVVGVVQLIAAFGIWSRRGWGRWIGIISASCNAVIQLFFIAAFPLASLALLAIDILVIYGLASYAYRET